MLVVVIAKALLVLQLLVVSIGVSTVAAAIHVASDVMKNGYGIAEIDLTPDVVAAINVVDITTIDDDTGRQVRREVVVGDVVDDFIYFFIRGAVLLHGVHIGHAAAAEEVVDNDF